MPWMILIFGAIVACCGGWIYGEAKDNRGVRVVSTIGTVIVFSVIAAVLSDINRALGVGIPLSTAFHEYLDASAAQLTAGHIEFVVDKFSGFKERARVTYETGALLRAIQLETERMKAGPQSE